MYAPPAEEEGCSSLGRVREFTAMQNPLIPLHFLRKAKRDSGKEEQVSHRGNRSESTSPFRVSRRNLLTGGAACVLTLALGAAPAGVAQATASTDDAKAKVRPNIGCGSTPTPGWLNVDNSLTVRLARWPALLRILARSGLIGDDQLAFARIVVDRNIV